MFFEPATGDGGGEGGIAEPITGTTESVFGEGEGETTPTPTPTTPTEPVPTPPQPTARELAQEIVGALKPAAGAAPAKTYTPEQLDQMFNVWKPSPDLLKAVREGDEAGALQALVGMRDGMLKQFHTLVDYQIKIALQDMESKFAPALGGFERMEAERQENSFFEANADLKDSRDLVRTVFQAMRSSGETFKDATEASKAVADRARTLLGQRANNGNGTGNGQPADTNNQTNNPPKRPANLTGGSQASGPRSGESATDVKTNLKDIFAGV